MEGGVTKPTKRGGESKVSLTTRTEHTDGCKEARASASTSDVSLFDESMASKNAAMCMSSRDPGGSATLSESELDESVTRAGMSSCAVAAEVFVGFIANTGGGRASSESDVSESETNAGIPGTAVAQNVALLCWLCVEATGETVDAFTNAGA